MPEVYEILVTTCEAFAIRPRDTTPVPSRSQLNTTLIKRGRGQRPSEAPATPFVLSHEVSERKVQNPSATREDEESLYTGAHNKHMSANYARVQTRRLHIDLLYVSANGC